MRNVDFQVFIFVNLFASRAVIRTANSHHYVGARIHTCKNVKT